jgi:uncharacterized protein (DUF1330 family)
MIQSRISPKALVISEYAVRDERATAQYRQQAAASIEAYGGCYLVRGAAPELLEGEGTGRLIVIVEFPSAERAQAWYDSIEYAPARVLRRTAFDRRLTLVECVEGV